MENSFKEEAELVKQLKALCNEKGKEINGKESAKILHKLGLVYFKRSPDKLSLIRSAVLLNAAIIRKPSNVEDIKKDLKQIHLHLLKISKAKHSKFDVSLFAKIVRILVKCMRVEARADIKYYLKLISDEDQSKLLQLEKEKIKVVKRLQVKVTNQYTEIMKFISDWCIQAMGEPLCKYALVGMGSLARMEITPYSDFEHIIVLEDEIIKRYGIDSKEYENILEYFRWYSVLFQMVVIELGETVLPCVAIPSLNDPEKERGKDKNNWFYDSYTVNGISFDGMQSHACKFPLGRAERTENKPWTTELIRPISEMVKYLDTEEDLKNGYKLASILTATCFVSGYEKIYDEFSNLVEKRMQEINEHDSSANKSINKQLEKDFRNFDTVNNLQNMTYASNINHKRVVYRSTTLFIAALGRKYSIHQSSSFDIIQSLKEARVIDSNTAHELAYAVSVACELRMQIYCSRGRQDDFVQILDWFDASSLSPAADLIKIIGEKSLVDYFEIAWNLQNMIRGNKYAIRGSNPNEEVRILYLFAMFQRLIDKWQRMVAQDQTHILNVGEKCLIVKALITTERYQTALDLSQMIRRETNDGNIKNIMDAHIGHCLMAMNRFTDTCQHLSQVANNLPESSQTQSIGCLYLQYGKCLYEKSDFKEALKMFEKSLECFETTPCEIMMLQTEFLLCKYTCLLHIGMCLLAIGNIKQALRKAKQCLELHEKYKVNSSWLLASSYQLLGQCLYGEGKYSEAKSNFKNELELYKMLASSPDALKCIQQAEQNIAACLQKMSGK